jgi:hypothetical protein
VLNQEKLQTFHQKELLVSNKKGQNGTILIATLT